MVTNAAGFVARRRRRAGAAAPPARRPRPRRRCRASGRRWRTASARSILSPVTGWHGASSEGHEDLSRRGDRRRRTGARPPPHQPRPHRHRHHPQPRRRSRALRELGAEPVVVDGLDRDGVRAAVAAARPDAIVHQMTALGGDLDLRKFERSFATTNRLRTEGTDHLRGGRARGRASSGSSPRASAAWPYARVGGAGQDRGRPARPATPQAGAHDARRRSSTSRRR